MKILNKKTFNDQVINDIFDDKYVSNIDKINIRLVYNPFSSHYKSYLKQKFLQNYVEIYL